LTVQIHKLTANSAFFGFLAREQDYLILPERKDTLEERERRLKEIHDTSGFK
jgi:hypothetical protein